MGVFFVFLEGTVFKSTYGLHFSFLICFCFIFRACIVIATLFIVSATGIFIRALRSLVVERHPIRVRRFSFFHQLFLS